MAASPLLPKLVGQRVKRREDPRLIQGRGTYVDDIKIAGMQHLAFKRSDVAHGRIRCIDVSAAEAMEGVEAVFTGAQIAEMLAPMPIGTPFSSPPHRAVAVDTVRYGGEAVAVVVASDRYVARDAADAIVVDFEALPAVVDPELAMKGMPTVIYPEFPNNLSVPLIQSGTGVDAARQSGRHSDRKGVCRGRGRDLAADASTSVWSRTRWRARRRRALRARQGVDDHLVVHAEPAHPALAHRRDDGPRAGSGSCDRAGSRRRVRRQDQHLRRGVRRGRHFEAAGHPRQVGRGSLRGVRRHDARSRHHRLRGDGGASATARSSASSCGSSPTSAPTTCC